MQQKEPRYFSVLELKLDTGERLPCLVDRATWLPCRVATRWVVRYRRLRVQASTLVDNLRILGRGYSWAANVAGFDLDQFLLNGSTLTPRQIESLAVYLQAGGREPNQSQLADEVGSEIPIRYVSASFYDHQIEVLENFLVWTLDNVNRGGQNTLTLAQLSAERSRLHYLFHSLHTNTSPSQRYNPLESPDIDAIRAVLKPTRNNEGQWIWPEHGFSQQTRLRNWLMFETALQLGLRRGELLKLRLDSLPRGSGDSILVMRHVDDQHDHRTKEPAVKTTERSLPLPDPSISNLRFLFRSYLTSAPPLGRVRGKTPYLFVTQWGPHIGAPLSKDAADDIIQQLGSLSGVTPLSWHRLRHTWAECIAAELLDEPGGQDALMYLGGWTNESSPQRYIQNAQRHRANGLLRDRQLTLYDPEV